MFYRFDIDKWIIHLLPPVIRKRAIYAFLRSMMYPVKQLQVIFQAYKQGIDSKLTYNSFQNYLVRFLNSLFYFEYEAIYITDVVNERTFLSFASEAVEPTYISYIDEAPAAAMYLFSFSPNNVSGSFIVHVPAVLSESDIATVYNWVSYYKMAGTNFKIESYE